MGDVVRLVDLWKDYDAYGEFNLSSLPEELFKKGVQVEYKPNSILVSRGEFPDSIYFIQEGTVAGIREYANGNTYNYFQLDEKNGSIGLLEVLAKQEKYIATIISVTTVKALQMDAAIVYQAIMKDIDLLRKCVNLLSHDLYQRSGNDGVLYYLSGIDRIRYYLIGYYESHRNVANEKGQVIVDAEYQEIANGIGMSIRTVGRNLQKLKLSEEIKSYKKKIVIGDKQYKKLIESLYT